MREKKPKRRRGCLSRLIGIALILLFAWILVMYADSCVIRLEYTDVYLDDLPAAFDGKTILFISDAHVGCLNSAERAGTLFDTLQTLNPDLLLLGGDYVCDDLSTVLYALVTGQNARDLQNAWLEAFFARIKDFYAPLGKFGVAGNHDRNAENLADAMEEGGVTLLRNRGVRLPSGNSSLTLVGLDDWTTGVQNTLGMASMVKARECVVALSHNPVAFDDARTRKSADGANWFDLMLSGHTHGGQVMIPYLEWIPGRILGEMPYVSGWYAGDGAQLLVSNGVGTSFLPLRFRATPNAHLLTLHTR